MSETFCVICKNTKVYDDFVQPRQIRIDTINRASKNRGDTLVANVGDYVHTLCRKEYIHVWYISNEANKEHVPRQVGREVLRQHRRFYQRILKLMTV